MQIELDANESTGNAFTLIVVEALFGHPLFPTIVYVMVCTPGPAIAGLKIPELMPAPL